MQIELSTIISLHQWSNSTVVINKAYFKKEANSCFDSDNEIINACTNGINNLGILYFLKKEANRFYDCDNGIKNACSNVINDLGISDVSIMVSNSIYEKLGPKILY